MAYKDPKDPRARAARRKHYRKNKKAYKARAIQAKILMQEFVYGVLLSSSCVDCGEDDIVVLEFDHGPDKRFTIAKALQHGYGRSRIEAEMSKCVVRCANCHRRKTARDNNWVRHRVWSGTS